MDCVELIQKEIDDYFRRQFHIIGFCKKKGNFISAWVCKNDCNKEEKKKDLDLYFHIKIS